MTQRSRASTSRWVISDKRHNDRDSDQSWDTFWGRPGYGAPRDSTQRENLMKNLYFAENNKVEVTRCY